MDWDPVTASEFTGGARRAFAQRSTQDDSSSARLMYHEAARDIPVYRTTDVLVVGGGPAGCAAAYAAAKIGADVTLVERYGYLGGMSTGGLVIWIDRMTDWAGHQVIAGFANDLFDRLPRGACQGPARETWGSRDPSQVEYWTDRSGAFRGVVTWSPSIDPERLKIASTDLLLGAGVKLMFHTWGAAPIVDGGNINGIIFESKEGRKAIFAKVVVDTTGDGDLYAYAGAPFESDIDSTDMHHCVNVAWCWAGVDMERWFAFKHDHPKEHTEFMRRGIERYGFLEKPHAAWRNDVALFMGPRLSGYSVINIEDLTTVEIESRRRMEDHLTYYRDNAPGFENAWIMLSAPQIGSRHSRRLVGAKRIDFDACKRGLIQDDEVGVCPSPSPAYPNISIPYGSLVPLALDNILAAGRHISCDPQSHTFLREIPECWLTGQAAGVGAAIAANRGCRVRDVNVGELQRELTKQGVYLHALIQRPLLPVAPLL